MMLNWARATCGMMGRSPDFMNVTLAAWGAASEYFARGNGKPEYAQNVRRYYEYIRENDIVLTHSLINLQRSRNVAAAKVQIGRSARFVGQQAIQLHGGIGMTMEASVGHYFKRVTMIDTMFGDADHHLERLAEEQS